MAQLTLDIAHGLDQERAKQAAQLALTHYLQRYGSRGLQANWSSPTRVDVVLDVRGVSLRGFVEVLPTTLRVSADVPLLLRPFKAVATAAIERETQRWIDHVKSNAPAP